MDDPRITDSPYAWGISVIAGVYAIGNVVLGLAILWAPQRLKGLSFMYVLQFASAFMWGIAFLAIGLLGLYGQFAHRMWPARLAHSAGAVMAGIWACAFAYGAFVNKDTSLTGIVAYGIFICLTHAVIAVVTPHRSSR